MLCHGEIKFTLNIASFGGAIYTTYSDLTLRGNITFENNKANYAGGGVYAEGGIMRMTGSVSYTHNKATSGGGMWLDDDAQLVLESPVSVQFYNNQAEEFGGAIFKSDSDYVYENQCQTNIGIWLRCFYRIEAGISSRFDIHLNFSHNSANNAGTVLYGGALDLCRVNKSLIGYQFLQNISTFIPSIKEQNSSIASKPLKACFCENGSINCSNRHKTVNIVPGRTFSLSIVTVGQLDTPVSSNIKTKFLNRDISTEKKYLKKQPVLLFHLLYRTLKQLKSIPVNALAYLFMLT